LRSTATTTDYGAAAEMFSAFLLVTLNEETAHAIGVPFSGLQDQIWSMIRLGVLVWMMYPVQSRWTLITDHLQKWCFNDTMASPQAGHVGNSVDVMNAWLLHWHPFTLSILIPLSCPPWSLETSWNCLKIFLGTMYMYVAAIHSIYSHFSFLYHQNLVHRHHPLPSRATRIFDSNCFSHSRSSSKLLYLALARVNHSCRWGRMSRGSLLDGLVLFLQAL